MSKIYWRQQLRQAHITNFRQASNKMPYKYTKNCGRDGKASGTPNSVSTECWRADSIGSGRRNCITAIPKIQDAAADRLYSSYLIGFLKATPDSRFLRGVRYQQRFMLLVAVLEILSGSRSSRDLKAFAKRHRQESTQARTWISSVGRRTPPS